MSLFKELIEQDYIPVENSDAFKKMYPESEYGIYRPQPNSTPSSYPCLVREECICDNPNGADTAVLSIIYIKES